MLNTSDIVKVRIKETPHEHELDGVRVDRFERGTVCDVSPSIGSWLIAEGYADPEMRQTEGLKRLPDVAHDRHRRRSTDR